MLSLEHLAWRAPGYQMRGSERWTSDFGGGDGYRASALADSPKVTLQIRLVMDAGWRPMHLWLGTATLRHSLRTGQNQEGQPSAPRPEPILGAPRPRGLRRTIVFLGGTSGLRSENADREWLLKQERY